VPSRLQQRVIDEATVWAAAEDLADSAEPGTAWRDRIALLLQVRADYLNRPDPTRWRSGDIHELFMTYVAPRQVDAWGLAEHGLHTVRDFLRFLDATDRLHPASTRVPTLLKELDRLAPKFPAVMADRSQWRLAKRVFTAVLADGVTLDADPATLDAWAARFTARDPDGRREVLGELMDKTPGFATGRLLIHDGRVAMIKAGAPPAKHLAWPDLACDCGCEQRLRFPPISLPTDAVLATQVAGDRSGLLCRLAALIDWAVSAARSADDRGMPRKADRTALAATIGLPARAPALDRTWQLAIDFDILELRRTRIAPGDGAALVTAALSGGGDPTRTLDLWSDLADALVHPPVPKGGDALQGWLDPWAPRFLGRLYGRIAAGETTVELEDATDDVIDEYASQLPPGDPDLFAALGAARIRTVLADLADHGAIAVTGLREDPDDRVAKAAAELGVASWSMQPVPGARVALTDLGRYLVRRRLLAENADAPLVS
jgi:hypothetical protein